MKLILTISTFLSVSNQCSGFLPATSISHSQNNVINVQQKGANFHNFLYNEERYKLQRNKLLKPSSSPSSSSSTRLYKKWGPRWNPTPDSDYYRRGDGDGLGGYDRIHYDGRKRRSKFIPVFGLTRIFSLQRFLVVSELYI